MMSSEDEHGPTCQCGHCRLDRGLCPSCGEEPNQLVDGKGTTFGEKCDLIYINGMRAKNGCHPLTLEEYRKI